MLEKKIGIKCGLPQLFIDFKKTYDLVRRDIFYNVGTTLTNQNSINEEIKSKLKSGNACSHSMLNLLSFS